MYSGFSGLFYSKSVPTRIETYAALQKPLDLINQLRTKEAELKKDAKKEGPASVDYGKHHAVSTLLTDIDQVIADFNEQKSEFNPKEDTMDIIKLVRKLSGIVTSKKNEEKKILSTSRNQTRARLSDAVYYGTYGVTTTAGFALTVSTIGKLFTLAYVAPRISKKVWEATGLNDISPDSIRIINELIQVLDDINQNLTKKLNPQKMDTEDEDADFRCPIGLTIMKDPLLFIKDGRNYEKSNIMEWFARGNRSSPLVPSAKIPFDKKPDDYLIEDYNFKSLLERFRREHPLIDQEEESIETKPSI